jgi:hypothetical protein
VPRRQIGGIPIVEDETKNGRNKKRTTLWSGGRNQDKNIRMPMLEMDKMKDIFHGRKECMTMIQK